MSQTNNSTQFPLFVKDLYASDAIEEAQWLVADVVPAIISDNPLGISTDLAEYPGFFVLHGLSE